MRREGKSAQGDAYPRWQWLLLLTVVAFEYTRPMDGILSFLAPLRLGGVATLGLVVVFLMRPKRYLGQDRIYTFTIAFWLLICVSVFYAPNNRAAFNLGVAQFWVVAGFIFPLAAVLTDKEKVYRFFFFWIVVQTIFAVLVATSGGHGPGSYLWDENDAALALNMAIPYAVFLARFPGISRAWKLFLYGCIPVFIGAIGISASRGGVVGLGALILVMIALSERPIRNGAIVALTAAIALTIIVKMLPSAYMADMENINNPEDSTRDERLWSWSIGWVMYKEHPVLGVGAGNYPWTNHLYAHKSPLFNPKRKILGGRQAHSLYFTLLPELGTAGVIIFFGLLRILYNRYRNVRKYYLSLAQPSEDAEKFELLFKAMLASCFAFLVAGAFISVLYYPPFWHLVGMVGATYLVAAKTLPGFNESLSTKARSRRPGRRAHVSATN